MAMRATLPLKLVIFCLLKTCVECQDSVPKTTNHRRRRLQRVILSILLGALAGLFLSVAFGGLVRWFVRFINRTPALKGPVVFSPKIHPKTLQSALNTESQLLGSRPRGTYYRTVLDNGLVIAVKRVETFENHHKRRRIHEELQRLATLRHRNLMSLRAYVRESDRFYLVYDYMANGSLEDAMKRVREDQLQLSWDARLRIAVGIVKALQYLHFTCIPRCTNCNLKPSNVILDAEFEPRLVDFGLAKLLGNLESAYSAPESLQNCCRNSEKSDIYSFGMILGVLLTGRDPTDALFGGSLGGWLKQQVEETAGEGREALDKTCILPDDGDEEDEMLMALRITVVCLSDVPADRPSSDELVSMLTQLHSF